MSLFICTVTPYARAPEPEQTPSPDSPDAGRRMPPEAGPAHLAPDTGNPAGAHPMTTRRKLFLTKDVFLNRKNIHHEIWDEKIQYEF